jgi:hypothetical protein
MCDAIFNHRRVELGVRDKGLQTVPCQGTPRGGHIALRLMWGWTGDLLGWLEENRSGPERAPLQPWRSPQALQYSSHTVHGGAIVAVGENRMGTRWGVTKIFTDSLLRGSHVAQAGLQLVTAKDDLACLLSASTSQVRDGSCVPPHLVSAVLGWNSGLTQLGELCPLSGRASPGSFIFWSHFAL